MKTLLFLAGFTWIASFPTQPVAQLDDVVEALASGDADRVGDFFDATVELVLLDFEDILPKAKAKTELTKFFVMHPVKGFARVHGGSSASASGAYVIGTLNCEDAKYRVYVYGKVEQGTTTIQEFRIENE